MIKVVRELAQTLSCRAVRHVCNKALYLRLDRPWSPLSGSKDGLFEPMRTSEGVAKLFGPRCKCIDEQALVAEWTMLRTFPYQQEGRNQCH
jgi:hypothetical protein